MAKNIKQLTLAQVQTQPQVGCDIHGMGHPTHECQVTAEEVNVVGNFNRGNYQCGNNFNAMGQRHPGFSWSSPNGSLNSWQQSNLRLQGLGPPVKAKSKVVDKQTETPLEEKNEEQKSQNSGVQQEIEESRHMPALPFPQKMKREKLDKCFGRFLKMLKQLYVNIPFTEVLTQVPAYAKFLKEILSSKRKLEETTVVKLNAHCSAILQNKNSSEVWGPRKLHHTMLTTILPEGIIKDNLVRVDKFVFPVDFIVVDIEVNKEVPLILRRPFLCTGRAILDIYEGQLMLRVGTEKVVFQMKRMVKYPSDESGTVDDEDLEVKKIAEALEMEEQVVYEEEIKEEASNPNVELKVLPTHLKYAFLETNNFPVIISADLIGTQEQ
ncbi:uncharacterized protein [Nicotiana tomentosiformis]|uniref:uncharacterized protein n=1 Tax=Nicotiana tomentosiformis TaxID=4098 RepID=UPI00051B6B24|nr:uncharacterized protein LOC104100516 [Nicotiana tomentosiformis]